MESIKAKPIKQRVGWWLPGAGGGGNGEMMVEGCKLLVLGWISSGDLMYSMSIIINTIYIAGSC